MDPIRSASRIRSENRDTLRICCVGYLFFRVKFEPFSARVQVKSRVSKFSSRLGLESRTRVREYYNTGTSPAGSFAAGFGFAAALAARARRRRRLTNHRKPKNILYYRSYQYIYRVYRDDVIIADIGPIIIGSIIIGHPIYIYISGGHRYIFFNHD